MADHEISGEVFRGVVLATLLQHLDHDDIAAVLTRAVETLVRLGADDDAVGRALSRFACDLGFDRAALARDMRRHRCPVAN